MNLHITASMVTSRPGVIVAEYGVPLNEGGYREEHFYWTPEKFWTTGSMSRYPVKPLTLDWDLDLKALDDSLKKLSAQLQGLDKTVETQTRKVNAFKRFFRKK